MSDHDRYNNHIRHYAERYGLDWWSLKAQMMAESAGDPLAVSKAQAMGLFQILPSTWVWLWRDRVGLRVLPNPFVPIHNVETGCLFMHLLLVRYRDRVALGELWPTAWAAYNWGPGNVDRLLAKHDNALARHSLPAETQDYLERIERWVARITA